MNRSFKESIKKSRKEKSFTARPSCLFRISCIFCIFVFLFGTVLCGCAREPEEEPVEITLVHGWGRSLEPYRTMQNIYEEFSQENPDILLKQIPYSDSTIVVSAANDMLAVGKMPDIVSTNGLSYFVKNAVKCGQAMDLMPYIEEDPELKEKIHPSVFETWETEDGSLYTMPEVLEVSGYWYNEVFFKEAGLVDVAGNAAAPSTWEQFMDAVRRLKEWTDKTGKERSVFCMEDEQMLGFLFLARLAGEGEKGLAAACHADSPMDRDTLEAVIQDLDYIKSCSSQADNLESARQSFREGGSVIYFNGVWESDVLKGSPREKEFKYAGYPTDSGKSLAYVSPSSGYVLAAQTDERKAKACIRFLKYMLSEKVQTRIAIETGQVPSNPNIDRTGVTESYPLFGDAFNTVFDADIQIKTISSVWTEDRIQVVKQYLGAKTWDTEHWEEMLWKLNGP